MRRTSRIWIAAAVLTATGSGCAGAAVPASPAPAPAPAQRANPADVEFMTGMIHHHAQALLMAGLATTNDAMPSIQTLSGRIIVSQTDEIALMQLWLHDMGEPVPEVTASGMVMMPGATDHNHDTLMPGMLTPEEMAALERSSGAEFDRLFLQGMIKHHQGALQMVDTLFSSHGGGVDDSVYKFASDTFADQGSEIDRMQNMLAAMSGSEPR